MRKQHFFIILHFVSAPVLAALQFLDEKFVDSYKDSFWAPGINFVFHHKIEFSIILTIILVSVGTSQNTYFPKRFSRKIRQAIMNSIIKDLFNNNGKEIRVTLFRDAGIMRNIFFYAKDFLNSFGDKYKSKNRFKMKKYIYAKERVGTEYLNSRTYFAYSLQTEKECQGIAGRARHFLESIEVSNLPDIKNCNLNEIDMRKKKSQIVKSITEYMVRGYIKDFETLKRLNIRSRHFYGDVVYNREGKPDGVIVIDSVQDNSPFSEDIKRRIAVYKELIGSVV